MTTSRSGPKLAKIAETIGVSTATVSNALSGKGRVSDELAARIRRKADELGYVASSAGRALRTGRSGVIGLVLPDIANPLFPQIAQAIEHAATQAGYGVLIGDSRGEIGMQTEAIGRLVERGVDGMVVVPRRGTRVIDIDCPVAVIDTPSTPGNTVSADHFGGGELVARHLAALGHRRVLLVGANRESNVQNDRLAGMRSVSELRTETLWLDERWYEAGQGGTLSLAEKMREGFTAIATVSDMQALRALTELQRNGWRIPEDVSVTGFDDLPWTSIITPSLTSVRMDMARIAGIAIEVLCAAILDPAKIDQTDRKTLRAPIQTVAMTLVERNSTAPPPIRDETAFKGELA
ncbi:LacI family DNA-binding transcriptional regulator [Pararhizobium mangrovi]|uniref:LacI family transcriptional regulator n=1 Tax=Pararhizobium mangrovi TaxID=2590452 RepID=A0A506UI18_9HYPH|nr:LacI family DNA-binding transcriptional regulator [Pararhizobium mangrovi]TPW32956.1 LacI family transcriptional regulator [Pararhizobium mangrovi]